MHGLTLPIFKLLNRYRGAPNPQIISGMRYLEAGETTVDEAIRSLQDIQYRALLKLHCWIRDYYHVLSGLGPQVTVRTLPELLVHGILLTRQWHESFPDVDGWLASLPQARQSSQVRPALRTSLEILSRSEWQLLHGHRTNIQALGIGFTHCVTAIYSGQRHYARLHTGSTLINWGTLISQLLPHGGGTENLQTWFRKARQLRFQEKEQKIVDLLVKEALDRWDSWVRGASKDYDDVKLNAYNTGKRGTSEYKAFTALVRKARGPALQRLVGTSYNFLPHVIKASFCSHNSLHVGASYVGQHLELKKKCPMCETLYKFRLAHSEIAIDDPEVYWDARNVGECDIARRNGPRCCCSEALAFILSVAAEGTTERLLQEMLHRLGRS